MDDDPKRDGRNSQPPEAPQKRAEALDPAVAPEPAADEAVKAALNIAASVGRSDPDDNLGLAFDNMPDSVSLHQIIDQAEQRSRALFEQAVSDDHEPLEELDVLDITAQFGRPSESIDTDDGSSDSVNGFGDTKDLSPSVIPPPVDTEPLSPPPEGVPQSASRTAEPVRPIADPPSIPPAEPSPPPNPNESGPPPRLLRADEIPAPLENETSDERQDIQQLVEHTVSNIKEGTYFEILNLPTHATDQEVREAYQRLRHEFREERFKDAALSDMRKDVSLIRAVVDEAFEVLRRPQTREAYRRAALDDGV